MWVAASSKWKSMQYTAVTYAFAFNQANAAYLTTNAAYASINSNWTVTNALYSVSNSAFTHANAAYDVANNALPNVSNAVFVGNLRVTGNLLVGTNTVTIKENHIISAEYYRMNTSNHMVVIPDGNRVNTLFTLVNVSFDTANASYTSANNVGPQIAPTYNTANAAYTTANDAYTSSNSANSYANTTYVKLTAPNQTITGDLSITGNLTLLGNATTLLSNNLIVNDSLIYLAANNDLSDILDIGFVGHYSNGTANLHTGLFRDHSTKQYFLFSDLAGPEPETINDLVPYANGMINAVLNANFITSNLTLGGANAINWITSNYTATNAAFGVANAAYGAANNVGPQIAPAFNTANAAYGVANTALQNTSGTFAGDMTITGNVFISKNNVTQGGLILADDGDIVDLNDGWGSLRFTNGVRIYSGNRSGTPAISLGSGGSLSTGSRGITKASMPAGTILQVVNTMKSDTFTSGTSETWLDITGMSATITPTSSTSKIYVHVCVGRFAGTNSVVWRVLRNSGLYNAGDAAGSRLQIHAAESNQGRDGNHTGQLLLTYIDSPATTSSLTYQLQFRNEGSNFALNRNNNDADAARSYDSRSSSSIILMEIAQ
jgi:hypothetical protein